VIASDLSEYSTNWTVALRRLVESVGDNPEREGLRDTPRRVWKAYHEMLSGYHVDVESIFTVFENCGYDEMVLLRNVEFVSVCEHHLLPFTGVAHVAYLPKRKIVGLSKLARLLDAYCKRLQVQERICVQVTQALDHYLRPLGSACVIQAKHSCIACRGAKKTNLEVITSSLTGEFRDAGLKAELLSLIGLPRSAV